MALKRPSTALPSGVNFAPLDRPPRVTMMSGSGNIVLRVWTVPQIDRYVEFMTRAVSLIVPKRSMHSSMVARPHPMIAPDAK
jgi:hypothetical protein